MSDLGSFIDRPGAALLEGWSDDGARRILLPDPVETRVLPWERACEWRSFLDSLEMYEGEGGWVGFVSYEAMACEEGGVRRRDHPPEPAAFFALHRNAGVSPAAWAPSRRPLLPPRDAAEAPALRDSAHGAYAQMVDRIREAIRDGEVYQVNLTRAFTLNDHCDAAELYRTLTGAQPPRSSAFLIGEGWAIASASPEVLLRFDRNTGVAESRPIKGTIRRSDDDASAIAALLASEKDASEHLMIVDVVRNDFGKIAPPGAVSVPAFRTIRTLEHVHHLESTVRAEGLQHRSISEVLGALAPAASITGAPKRAAVQMIRDVEPVARGVYCGTIGFIDFHGRSEWSVAIRTAVATNDAVRYHAGGGIVWDSDAAAEDDETRAKSAAFLQFAGAPR